MIKLRKVIFFQLFFISYLLISCKSAPLYTDRLQGKTVTKVTELYGDPQIDSKYIVDKEYRYKSEIEPDYYKYFSQIQIEFGIEVEMQIWEKKDKKIVVWSYFNKEWIVFSSIEYNPNKIEF